MARPKTKGATLSIRLSLAAHAEAERRATAKGLDVRAWVEEAIERTLTEGHERRREAVEAVREVIPNPKKHT